MPNRLFAHLSLFLLLALSLPGWAGVDVRTFSSDVERQRYQALVEELRCPKCQNQNLADSNSPIAADLRDEIFRMLEEGKSDREIVDFLVARYGDFVLYKPPVKETTLVLWVTPGLLVLIGLVTVLLVRRRKSQPAAAATLANDEQRRLQALLGETGAPDNSASEKGDDR